MTSARNTIVPIKAKTLKIIIGLALASLFLANLVIFTDVYKQPLIYSIMSAGSMIFSANENKINFIIDNNLNNQEKILRIYSINYSDPIRISTSTMSETTSGKQISSDNILFNGNASTNLIQNSVEESPLKVTISLNNVTEPGVYNGFFFLEDDDISSIPITIDIRPPLEKIIILIIDGIAVSIIFWKILKFINLRYQIVIDPQTLAQSAKTVSFSDYITNSKITKGSVIKNALLDLGSVIFGIVIGLVPILNDDFVNNIRIISPFVVLVLFVIGLGLGSIKELIYSKSEPQES